MPSKSAARVVPVVADGLPAESPPLVDEVRITDVTLTGEYSNAQVELVEVASCRIERAQLTGSRLTRCSLVDCLGIASDFSGVILEDCSIRRVEFHECRFSGLEAQHSHFEDVAYFDCKIDRANFRMTEWKAAEFHDCELLDADFYGSSLPGSRFQGCDLSGAQLSKADLSRSQLNGSKLDRIQGAEGLRGVIIGSDQVIPAALAVFGSLNIVVDDNPVQQDSD
jgi:uncharacterized protein YjbI with pentapeptide repeats